MARLIYSEDALADLERLVEFLKEAAPEAAGASLDSILAALDILQEHPLLGRRLDRWRRELVISIGATGYLAAYRFDAVRDLIRVLRIRHQREAGYVE